MTRALRCFLAAFRSLSAACLLLTIPLALRVLRGRNASQTYLEAERE